MEGGVHGSQQELEEARAEICRLVERVRHLEAGLRQLVIHAATFAAICDMTARDAVGTMAPRNPEGR